MGAIEAELAKGANLVVVKAGCAYCSEAEDLLRGRGVDYRRIDSATCPELVEEIRRRKGHPTFPMIFLDGEFVGGCDDLQRRLGE